jgi:DNA-directed RNA polymerase sigma subunit (sigma70/sigma32)
MNTLAVREQLVLHLLFGMDENSGELDLRTVGERLSISHEGVRKIRDKALDKLRKKMLKTIRVG